MVVTRRYYPYEATAHHACMHAAAWRSRSSSSPNVVRLRVRARAKRRRDGPGRRAINWPGACTGGAAFWQKRAARRGVSSRHGRPRLPAFPGDRRVNATSRPRPPTPRIKRAPISPCPTSSEGTTRARRGPASLSSPRPPARSASARYIYIYIYPSNSKPPVIIPSDQTTLHYPIRSAR